MKHSFFRNLDLLISEIAPSQPRKHPLRSKYKKKYQPELVWKNFFLLFLLQVGALYGLYLTITQTKLLTVIYAFIVLVISNCLGVSAGVHRLWAHRTYKAKWPLRLLLILSHSMSFQMSAYDWVRDHRVHHKFIETDADPHNSKRGFFFSHMGWLMCRKHPEVIEKGKLIDMSDIEADPIVMFQKRNWRTLAVILCFLIPPIVPIYFWNESLFCAFFVSSILRYALGLHAAWFINSAAHVWGNKPYDNFIGPTDNSVLASITVGEGFHNFHHVFPWDYRSNELGGVEVLTSTPFINFFSKIGWAYDLKTVPEEVIRKRVERTGDGSHPVWGWGDKDMSSKDIEDTIIVHKKDE